MHMEMNQVWWMQFLMKVWVVIFYKVQEWHAYICSTSEAIYTVWLLNYHIKIKTYVKDILYLMDFLIKYIIDEAGGVVGVTPEGTRMIIRFYEVWKWH